MIIPFVNFTSIKRFFEICELESYFREHFVTIYINNNTFPEFFVYKVLPHHNFLLMFTTRIVVYYILDKRIQYEDIIFKIVIYFLEASISPFYRTTILII